MGCVGGGVILEKTTPTVIQTRSTDLHRHVHLRDIILFKFQPQDVFMSAVFVEDLSIVCCVSLFRSHLCSFKELRQDIVRNTASQDQTAQCFCLSKWSPCEIQHSQSYSFVACVGQDAGSTTCSTPNYRGSGPGVKSGRRGGKSSHCFINTTLQLDTGHSQTRHEDIQKFWILVTWESKDETPRCWLFPKFRLEIWPQQNWVKTWRNSCTVF